MNVMSCDKERHKFLHEDMSKQPFSRQGDSGKACLGNDTSLRLKGRKVNWAKIVAETPQAEGSAEVKVLLQEARWATVQGTKGRIRLEEG